jgi:hypothetical protein
MKESGIKALSEWAKGKPPGLVVVAQQLAVGAEALTEWLKSTFRLPRLKAGASPRPELGSRAQG